MPTPEQNSLALKRFVAGLLPEKIIYVDAADCEGFFWSPADGSKINEEWLDGMLVPILETEWPYIVSLAEQTLEGHEGVDYVCKLRDLHNTNAGSFRHVTSNFNQRATALARVKGVEIEL